MVTCSQLSPMVLVASQTQFVSPFLMFLAGGLRCLWLMAIITNERVLN